MADLSHPFQCIEAVKPRETGAKSLGYLLAACGPKLVSVRLDDGEIITQWTADANPGSAENDGDGTDIQERPAKKQKTLSNTATPSNVIKLTSSADHRHAVVVTDDKCLRVFHVSSDGQIEELSQRFMPKRPCAVQVLPDNVTILCADKFGDVYALPLLPEAPRRGLGPEAEQENPSLPDHSSVPFKPSATSLTVHSQRNRKTLEAQLKQKNATPKTKEPLKFEHKLLLGHVSMLTDLYYATQEVDGKQRGYIITADRDEHIRISRGPPQSHIIEGYCLGHKEFVSKVLVIPGTNLMISGGGDDWLGVWDWTTFKLLRKIDDFGAKVRHAAKIPGIDPETNPLSIAVSGIWFVPGKVDFVAVACENLPVLAWIPVSELETPQGEWIEWNVQTMGRPVLDITSVADEVQSCLISFDERSREVDRIEPKTVCKMRDAFVTTSSVDLEVKKSLERVNEITSPVSSKKSLNEFLYGVENLRKRTYKDRDEEDEAAEQDA